MKTLNIEYVANSELRAPPRRLRHQPHESRKVLQNSIQETDFVLPILIGKDGVIIDGLSRFEILKEMGVERVAIIRVEHLSSKQIRLLRLALNKIPQRAKWDEEALAMEFKELLDLDVNLELTGFEIPDIDRILEIGSGTADDIEEIDATQFLDKAFKAVSSRGDIWRLNKHIVACGDWLNRDLRRSVLKGEQVAACFADPPYNVPIAGHVSGLGAKVHEEFAMGSGEMSAEEFFKFLTEMAGAIKDSVVSGGVAFICMDWRSVSPLVVATNLAGFETLNIAVWVKSNPGMGSLYRSQHEMIVVVKDQGSKHRNNVELGKHGRSRSNVWQYRGVNVFGPERKLLYDHPTVKPAALVADAIRDVTKAGDSVLDPFLGSGTTLIAAERTKRRCIGVEISPKFVDLAIRRWEAETGLEAVRASDGLTYRQAAEATFPSSSAEAAE